MLYTSFFYSKRGNETTLYRFPLPKYEDWSMKPPHYGVTHHGTNKFNELISLSYRSDVEWSPSQLISSFLLRASRKAWKSIWKLCHRRVCYCLLWQVLCDCNTNIYIIVKLIRKNQSTNNSQNTESTLWKMSWSGIS